MTKGHYWICVVGPFTEAQRTTELQQSLRGLIRDAVGDGPTLSTGFGADEKVANRVMNAWNHEKNEPVLDIDADCGLV